MFLRILIWISLCASGFHNVDEHEKCYSVENAFGLDHTRVSLHYMECAIIGMQQRLLVAQRKISSARSSYYIECYCRKSTKLCKLYL